MPIRFRCVHCDKLLGIGRRKAGSTVKCPSCAQAILVPNVESVAIAPADRPALEDGYRPAQEESYRNESSASTAPAPKVEKKLLGPQLFENSDFEELLNPVALGGDEPKPKKQRGRELPPPLPPEPRGAVLPPPRAAEPPSPPPVGIVISPNRATWLSVGAVFVLAAVFFLGLLVGRFLKP